ncbi:MAG: hypothetical protein ACK49V_11915, partial [Actinomycetes bacterium]
MSEPDPGTVAVLDDIDRRRRVVIGPPREWWLIVGDPRTRAKALATISARIEMIGVSANDCDAETIHRTALALESHSVGAVILDGVDDIV